VSLAGGGGAINGGLTLAHKIFEVIQSHKRAGVTLNPISYLFGTQVLETEALLSGDVHTNFIENL